LARIGSAFIDVGLTQQTRIARKTSAGKPIQSIGASGTVLTRIRRTLINVDLAKGTSRARNAGARKSVQRIGA
jgi:hypothetical protein